MRINLSLYANKSESVGVVSMYFVGTRAHPLCQGAFEGRSVLWLSSINKQILLD